MANVKISQLPDATVPLSGNEVAPIVQSGITSKVPSSSLLTPYVFPFYGTGDIGNSLNTFMDSVANGNGGTVLLPQGSFTTSVPIVVPLGVKLQGAGKRSTTLQATAGFPAATPVVKLGRVTDTTVFDAQLLDLQLDCNHVANSIGVQGTNLNEGCGCFRAIVKNFRDIGINYIIGEHFSNEDLEVLNNSSSNNYCIKVHGDPVAAYPGNVSLGVQFSRVTTFGRAGSTIAGWWLKNVQFVGTGIHCEGATDGVLVDGDHVEGVINGIEAVSGTTTVVHFNGGSSPLVVIGLSGSFATNLLRDDLTNTTITDVGDAPVLPIWTRRMRASSPPTTVGAGSPYFVTENDDQLIVSAGANLGIVLPTPSSNTGRVLFIKSVTATQVTSAGSNVVPLGGGAAQSFILPRIPGLWSVLKCDGTSWVIIAQSDNNQYYETIGSSPYVLDANDKVVNNNVGGPLQVTLPDPATCLGRVLYFMTWSANAITSASSNIRTLTGGTTSTIVSASAGKWAILVSDGGSFWATVAAN